MDNEQKDVQLVTSIVKLLVKHPDNVEVTRTIDDLGVLLTLRVHAEDMAGIVGREGRTAKAIRTLLRVIGAQNDERVNLKIVEPHGAEERTQTTSTAEPTNDNNQPADTIYTAAAEEEAPSPYFNIDDIPEPLA